MRVFLVRHAKAGRRSRWVGDDRERPLVPQGEAQAAGIADHLAEQGLGRLITSPHRRCRETLVPLATRLGLPLELDEHLAEDADPHAAAAWIETLGDEPVALCSHGDLIPGVIAALGLEPDPTSVRCAKGSIWMLERRPGDVLRASYHAPAERAPEPPQRLAVLDLGSTSFHLLVADVGASGEIRPVSRERVMLRLGAAIVEGDGRIGGEVALRAEEAAQRLREVAKAQDCERLLPVATAALREAPDGHDLAARLGRVLGAPVRMLSGEQEARLIHRALRRRVPVAPGPVVALDLGGGSLELAVDGEEEVEWETTLPLGVTRLHREFVVHDPIAPGEIARIEGRVRRSLEPVLAPIRSRDPHGCLATGGTVRALTRLLLADADADGETLRGTFLGREELASLCERLLRSTHDERLRMPGMQRRRADLLPTGALILRTVADALALDGLTVSDWGLREGVLLEALGVAAP